MAADTAILSNVPLFERLDEDERELLASQLEEVEFQAGQVIFKRGDPGEAVFIVAAGQVQIFVEDTTGSRIVFETAKVGDFFGELSLLDGDPRSASAQAMELTRTLRVDRHDLQMLFRRHPDAAMDVLAIIGRRLREADKLLGSRLTASPNEIVEEKLTPIMRLADWAAAFSGTFKFLLVHAAWFAVWIAINVGWIQIQGFEQFDPYPFGLLTMVVSLEAIFLSCMVLISQSRQGAKDRIRSDAEYEANIRAGLEVTQLHVKIDSLHEQVLSRLATLERSSNGGPSNKTPIPAPKPSI